MSTFEGDDVYRVKRQGARFTVHHYPNLETRRPCCRVTATISPKDLGKHRNAHEDLDSDGAIACLERVYRHIERLHGRVVDNN
jgi:hypothetical protein